jgi:hypothetical protein
MPDRPTQDTAPAAEQSSHVRPQPPLNRHVKAAIESTVSAKASEELNQFNSFNSFAAWTKSA